MARHILCYSIIYNYLLNLFLLHERANIARNHYVVAARAGRGWLKIQIKTNFSQSASILPFVWGLLIFQIQTDYKQLMS